MTSPLDVAAIYPQAVFITQSRNGSPVGWPVLVHVEHGKIVLSTGYVFPVKALNAKRNPKVAVFFHSDEPAIVPEGTPLTLVQGDAEVFDRDLQANTDRFMSEIAASPLTPGYYKALLRIPGVLSGYVGYATRIYVEVTPTSVLTWDRGAACPETVHAVRPGTFIPTTGFVLPEEVETWTKRYELDPTLSVVGPDGYPVGIRSGFGFDRARIELTASLVAEEGSPACLTFDRTTANVMKNDGFVIRGHLDGEGGFIPEKVIGWSGTDDDRGVGSDKARKLMKAWNQQLKEQLAKEGRSAPKVRLPKG